MPDAPAGSWQGDWTALLGHRVRVMDGATGATVMGEGEVVAVCMAPSITLRDADGNLTHHSTSLPVEVSEWRRL